MLSVQKIRFNKPYHHLAGSTAIFDSGSKLQINPGAIVSGLSTGDIWFVDSANGDDDAHDGQSFGDAYATITKAVAAAAAGDTIFIKGSFDEAVTVGSSLTGLSIIGIGTGPNQATWTGTADEVCLLLQATDCVIENIKFRPPTYSSGTPAAIQLSAASYTKIRNCRFQGRSGSRQAIYSAAATSDNVEITDNEFIYMNTATYGSAILGVEASGLSYSGWQILRNTFNSCVTAIKLNGRVCVVADNKILRYGINSSSAVAAVCTLMIDMYGSTGTSSGGNLVSNNVCEGGYVSTLFKAGVTGDCWRNNWDEPKPKEGRIWFVDATNGLDTHGGNSWANSLATMSQALTNAAAGDTIMFTGTIAEGGLTLSANNVTIVGAGPRPNSNIWQEAATNTTLLTVTGDNCKLENIRFRIPTGNATSSIGLALSTANHLEISNCVFQGRAGANYAISSNGSSDNVWIHDCVFMYLNTATNGYAIYGHTYTADVIHSGWIIERCEFHSNTNHIVSRMRCSTIKDCTFAYYGLAANGTELTTTVCINLSGGANAKWNRVTKNLLGGGYSTDAQYVGGTNDDWTGNWNADVSEAEVGAEGVTIAAPAA